MSYRAVNTRSLGYKNQSDNKQKAAVFSEIHIKDINANCGQNVEFLNVIPRGTEGNR